jgi:hypothetical protein
MGEAPGFVIIDNDVGTVWIFAFVMEDIIIEVLHDLFYRLSFFDFGYDKIMVFVSSYDFGASIRIKDTSLIEEHCVVVIVDRRDVNISFGCFYGSV